MQETKENTPVEVILRSAVELAEFSAQGLLSSYGRIEVVLPVISKATGLVYQPESLGDMVPVAIQKTGGVREEFRSSLGCDAPLYGYDYEFFAMRFNVEWGAGHVNPGSAKHGFELFHDGNGYDDEDRLDIYNLAVGAHCEWGANHRVTKLAPIPYSENAENMLSRARVKEILAGQDESIDERRICYYPSVEALVMRASGTKNWSSGEVFVYAETPNHFLILCQIAPSSCEMMTLTHNGFHDVVTAYRVAPEELTAMFKGYMGCSADANAPPGAGEYETIQWDGDNDSGFIVRPCEGGFVAEEWRNGDIADNQGFTGLAAFRRAHEWVRDATPQHLSWRRGADRPAGA